MKKYMTLFISALVLFSFSSCADSRDKLMQDQVDYLNEMAEVIEGVADGTISSAEATEKFSEMKKTGDEFMERKKELYKGISAEDGKALAEKFNKPAAEAFGRYMKALEKLRKSGRMTQELREAVESIK